MESFSAYDVYNLSDVSDGDDDVVVLDRSEVTVTPRAAKEKGSTGEGTHMKREGESEAEGVCDEGVTRASGTQGLRQDDEDNSVGIFSNGLIDLVSDDSGDDNQIDRKEEHPNGLVDLV